MRCPTVGIASGIADRSANRNKGHGMQQFMWQPDILQVAKFLDAGVKRMQEIDPDAGSNI